MYDVKGNIQRLREELPSGVRLVAVSKYHPEEYIKAAYATGQRIFGENHVQELQRKQPLLPNDIVWHFLGHLQTNKVKYIAPYISVIESVDSERLIVEINRQALRNDRTIDVLLELHIAQEETKSGLTKDECSQLLASGIKERYANVRICGLMTMASHTNDEAQIESEFKIAADYFDRIKAAYFPNDDYFCERSWGMSGDYQIAIRQHATLIRIGTKIFGPRIY
jgi:PLP dependent protein